MSAAAGSARLFARVFRNADLRRLVLAWAASNLASRASAIAVAVYAYETDGIGAVGIVAFLRVVAGAVASPWLAVLADRRSRRLVLIGCDLARGLVLAGMALLVLVGAAPLLSTRSPCLPRSRSRCSAPRRWRSRRRWFGRPRS